MFEGILENEVEMSERALIVKSDQRRPAEESKNERRKETSGNKTKIPEERDCKMDERS